MTPARAFAAAAASYEAAATVQRLAAERLAARIAELDLPARPRILDVGAGTGFLTRALAGRLPDASFVVTDIAPPMVAQARRRMPAGIDARFACMDGQAPAVPARFDVVCSSFAAQWFADPPAALARLSGLCAPGGWLAVATLAEGTLSGWHQACDAEQRDARIAYLPTDALVRALPGAAADCYTIVQAFDSGLDFLRSLRALGAHGGLPAQGGLRAALSRFEREHGAAAEFHVATICARRPPAPGLFVTGTDTGVGKTLVAACLARRLGADYWKPAQTGMQDGDDDSATVAALAALPADRIHPPRHRFAAPLSPEAAAAMEDTPIGLDDFILPQTSRPLVVEGAGGVLVPVGGGATMADLMARLGLPVVLVARSTLGTINHTLLSLAALRRRGLAVAGVVLVGPPNPGNRAAIASHGRVRILAEMPWLDHLDADAVKRLSALLPERLGEAAPA
jgi:malonyl-CoA O-methyltransferase